MIGIYYFIYEKIKPVQLKKEHSPTAIKEQKVDLIKQKISKPTFDTFQPQDKVQSYQGTQPDGAVHLDEYGNVVVDKDLKRIFDYYLSAMGELSLDQMRQFLIEYAGAQLSPEQLKQLLDYFNQYYSYLNKADVFSQNLGEDLSLEDKMRLLSGFRNDVLGSEMANAFFADEQDYINFVLSDKKDDDLPEQQLLWLQKENQATEFHDVVIENQQFNLSGSINSDELYQYRINEYGQDAADRLSQLDQKRAQWQDTVNHYFEQRNKGSVSLEQLNSNYTPQEIRRLEALWRIDND